MYRWRVLVAARRTSVTSSLEGRLRGLVGTGIVPMIANFTTNPSTADDTLWTVAGEPVAVRLSQLQPRGNDNDDRTRWAVSFEILRPAEQSVERLVVASLAMPELFDADGTPLRRATARSRVGISGGVEYVVEYIGNEHTVPMSLRCEVPERRVQLDVPFAFEKLPVP